MSENTINPISSIRSSEARAPDRMPDRTPAASQVEFAIPTTAVMQTKAIATAFAEQEKTPAAKQSVSAPSGALADISLHFQVDSKTKELTVFIVDRKSKKVLRSIPADELNKLQAGDLLKLTA